MYSPDIITRKAPDGEHTSSQSPLCQSNDDKNDGLSVSDRISWASDRNLDVPMTTEPTLTQTPITLFSVPRNSIRNTSTSKTTPHSEHYMPLLHAPVTAYINCIRKPIHILSSGCPRQQLFDALITETVSLLDNCGCP